MNTITITHDHKYDKDSACDKAEKMIEDLANDYGLEIESDGEGYISFSGSGINGSVTIDHDQINFNAKLNFLMLTFKPVISNTIEAKLKEKF